MSDRRARRAAPPSARRRRLTVGAATLLVAAAAAVGAGPAGADLAVPSPSTLTHGVVVWGSNSNGQRNVPADLGDVTAIAAGGRFNVVIADGAVRAWGQNDAGQLAVVDDGNVDGITAGAKHAVAWSNGVPCGPAVGPLPWVAGWGDDTSGQATVPDTVSGASVTQVAAGGSHTVALLGDGSVVAWGANGSGQTNVPAGLSDIQAIAAGGRHSLALDPWSQVVAWGANDAGQRNVPAAVQGNAIAIAAGERHSLALLRGGTVAAWGANGNGQSTVPAGLRDVVAIAAGGRHSVALKADGSVVVWGANDAGQRNVPAGLRATAIAAGALHTIAMVRTLDVALVTANASVLPSNDVPLRNHLLAMGHRVTLVDDNTLTQAPVTAVLNAADVVVISSSVSTGLASWASFVRHLGTPIVLLEPLIAGKLGLVPTGTTAGTATGQKTVRITGTHPIAAGLPVGVHTVTNVATTFNWFKPVPAATVVATQPTNGTRAEIFALDWGGALAGGGAAEARRVGFFLGLPAPATANTTGWRLFEAALDWAALPEPFYVLDLADGVDPAWTGYRTDGAVCEPLLGLMDDETVRLTLTGVPVGVELELSLDLSVWGAWEGNGLGADTGDRWTLDVDGARLVDTTFAFPDSAEPTVTQAWPGNLGSVFPPLTSATSSAEEYLNSRDTQVQRDVYPVSVSFVTTSSTLVVEFSGIDLEPADGEGWSLAGVRVTRFVFV
jgi:hypothetical protein